MEREKQWEIEEEQWTEEFEEEKAFELGELENDITRIRSEGWSEQNIKSVIESSSGLVDSIILNSQKIQFISGMCIKYPWKINIRSRILNTRSNRCHSESGEQNYNGNDNE